MQGVMTSVHALPMIASPLRMARVFFTFTRKGTAFYQTGAPFLLSMTLLVVGLFLFMRARFSLT